MKILRAITSMDPASGGPASFVSRTNGLLRDKGHVVDVVTLDAPNLPWAEDVN